MLSNMGLDQLHVCFTLSIIIHSDEKPQKPTVIEMGQLNLRLSNVHIITGTELIDNDLF